MQLQELQAKLEKAQSESKEERQQQRDYFYSDNHSGSEDSYLQDRYLLSAEIDSEAYRFKMGAEDSSTTESIKEEVLRKGQVFKWKPLFEPRLSTRTLSTNFESLRVAIHYGHFEMEITVLFTKIETMRLFRGNSFSRGAFASVYSLQHEGQQYVVKNIAIARNTHNTQLHDIYKQYFLLRLADALGAGPGVHRLMGYDIVITAASAFFAMEKCTNVELDSFEQMSRQLMKNLKALHCLGFVHSDIKPQNIAFSPSRKKHVFLDFGLSRLISETQGQKIKTKFVGTVAYCSEEMKKCYILHKQAYVDMYCNDLHALELVLKCQRSKISDQNNYMQNYEAQMREKIKQEKLQSIAKASKGLLSSFICILRLQFQIYKQNHEQVVRVIGKCWGLPKSLHELLTSSNTPEQLKGLAQVKGAAHYCKERLLESKLASTQEDEVISWFVSEAQRKELMCEMMPIEYILSVGQDKFRQMLRNKDWAYKFYLIFNPFRVEIRAEVRNPNALRLKLARKISEALGRFNNPLQIYFYYLKDTLLYLWESLRQVLELPDIENLRLISFIQLSEAVVIEMEDRALSLIEDPLHKALKIVEYQIIWCPIKSNNHRRTPTLAKLFTQAAQGLQESQYKRTLVAIYEGLTLRPTTTEPDKSLELGILTLVRALHSSPESRPYHSITKTVVQLYETVALKHFPRAKKSDYTTLEEKVLQVLVGKRYEEGLKQPEFMEFVQLYKGVEMHLQQQGYNEMPVGEFEHCARVLIKQYNILIPKMLDLKLLLSSKDYLQLVLGYYCQRIATEPLAVKIDELYFYTQKIKFLEHALERAQQPSCGEQVITQTEAMDWSQRLRHAYEMCLGKNLLMSRIQTEDQVYRALLEVNYQRFMSSNFEIQQKMYHGLIELLRSQHYYNYFIMYYILDCLMESNLFQNYSQIGFVHEYFIQLCEVHWKAGFHYVFYMNDYILESYIRIKNGQGRYEHSLSFFHEFMLLVPGRDEHIYNQTIEGAFARGFEAVLHFTPPHVLEMKYHELASLAAHRGNGMYEHFLLFACYKIHEQLRREQVHSQICRTARYLPVIRIARVPMTRLVMYVLCLDHRLTASARQGLIYRRRIGRLHSNQGHRMFYLAFKHCLGRVHDEKIRLLLAAKVRLLI